MKKIKCFFFGHQWDLFGTDCYKGRHIDYDVESINICDRCGKIIIFDMETGKINYKANSKKDAQ